MASNSLIPQLEEFWDRKMAQWVMALAAEADDLSSSPTTHLVEGENELT